MNKKNWEGTVQGYCSTLSFPLSESGLPCQILRAWVCWEADIPSPTPGQGNLEFSKNPYYHCPSLIMNNCHSSSRKKSSPCNQRKTRKKGNSHYTSCVPTNCVLFSQQLCKANKIPIFMVMQLSLREVKSLPWS